MKILLFLMAAGSFANADYVETPYTFTYHSTTQLDGSRPDDAAIDSFVKDCQARGWKVDRQIKETNDWDEVNLKKSNTSLTRLLTKSQGCKVLDDACKKMIMVINRAGPEIFEENYRGTLMVPRRSQVQKITVHSGPNYRTEKTPTHVKAIMSKELADKINPMARNIDANVKACIVDATTCVQDELKIENLVTPIPVEQDAGVTR
jgi:hypothetical protein